MHKEAGAMAKKPLQIRELPNEIREALAQRAQWEGRSLAQQATVELRRSLEVDSAPRRAVLARILQRIEEAGGEKDPPPGFEPETLLREDRDR
jgi:plasmid stability protein